jgi:hypothetical protein
LNPKTESLNPTSPKYESLDPKNGSKNPRIE